MWKVYLKGRVAVFASTDGKTYEERNAWEVEPGRLREDSDLYNPTCRDVPILPKPIKIGEILTKGNKVYTAEDFEEFIYSMQAPFFFELGDSEGYTPQIVVDKYNNEVPTSQTTQIIVEGQFLDYVNNAIVNANNDAGINLSIVSQSFDEIVLDLTTNNVEQDYFITLETPTGGVTFKVGAANFQIITPTVTGSAPNLWVKSGANNGAVLSQGRIEMEQNNGNGWNEHAYFGAVSSPIKIVLEFTPQGLQNSAYARIRLNSTNNPSTSSGPRIDINNGNSGGFYSQTGAFLANYSPQNGDFVQMIVTPNKFQFVVNGDVKAEINAAFSLNNLYATFTGYRYFIAEDVKMKVFPLPVM